MLRILHDQAGHGKRTARPLIACVTYLEARSDHALTRPEFVAMTRQAKPSSVVGRFRCTQSRDIASDGAGTDVTHGKCLR